MNDIFENLNYVNYHKHDFFTNPVTPDSVASVEDYAKRAKELNQIVISCVNHGSPGHYIEHYDIAKKYDLKFLYGVEAYWVKDRNVELKDKTNNHIILLAKTEKGRRAINKILSQSAYDGFYYKTRIDIGQILSLPPDDVYLTTACIAYNGYGFDYSYETIKQFHNHFKDNMFLELQYHNTDSQKKWNKLLLQWSGELGIKIVMGCDSHYIYEDDAWKRTDYLKSKGITYEDEEGWFLDYPDVKTCIKRFQTQGILSDEQIYEAINNTNIFSTIDDYKCDIFNDNIKMPTLYQDLTKREKDMKLAQLVHDSWQIEKQHIPESEWGHYEKEIKRELKTIFEVDHSDYFLIYYEGIKHGQELGGVVTPTGRGSSVGCYCNKLLGLTKVDRIDSPVTLFFERFMSKSRMLEAKSMAD